MMTIEEEIQHLITFLRHPGGFDVDMSGILCIRPIDEGSPPTSWEVDWEEIDDGIILNFSKEFPNLEEAAQFFVEKRHYLCEGADFQLIRMKEAGLINE
jgi:hypothetical protein